MAPGAIGHSLSLRGYPPADRAGAEGHQAIDAASQRPTLTSDITGVQVRAGRLLLGWSRDRLGGACGIDATSIGRFEDGRAFARASYLAAIRAALEAAGVEFIAENGGAPGVRLKKVLE